MRRLIVTILGIKKRSAQGRKLAKTPRYTPIPFKGPR